MRIKVKFVKKEKSGTKYIQSANIASPTRALKLYTAVRIKWYVVHRKCRLERNFLLWIFVGPYTPLRHLRMANNKTKIDMGHGFMKSIIRNQVDR